MAHEAQEPRGQRVRPLVALAVEPSARQKLSPASRACSGDGLDSSTTSNSRSTPPAASRNASSVMRGNAT
jgi:hypothetical protein